MYICIYNLQPMKKPKERSLALDKSLLLLWFLNISEKQLYKRVSKGVEQSSPDEE